MQLVPLHFGLLAAVLPVDHRRWCSARPRRSANLTFKKKKSHALHDFSWHDTGVHDPRGRPPSPRYYLTKMIVPPGGIIAPEKKKVQRSPKKSKAQRSPKSKEVQSPKKPKVQRSPKKSKQEKKKKKRHRHRVDVTFCSKKKKKGTHTLTFASSGMSDGREKGTEGPLTESVPSAPPPPAAPFPTSWTWHDTVMACRCHGMTPTWT